VKGNNLGRKRRHPRIEELKEINIRKLVTGAAGARNVVDDDKGNRLRFVPEMINLEMTLKVYLNDRHVHSYQIVEREIPGRINSKVDPDRMYFYCVVVDGCRFANLYVDCQRMMVGSRISLGAYYTSQSVSGRLEKFRREWRKAASRKVPFKNN
jgi:hypothetical protein